VLASRFDSIARDGKNPPITGFSEAHVIQPKYHAIVTRPTRAAVPVLKADMLEAIV
jgi:hypothetical protein